MLDASAARRAIADGRLKELRELYNLSQADIANAVGVTASAVNRWETGIRRPRRETAKRLAAFMRKLEAAA